MVKHLYFLDYTIFEHKPKIPFFRELFFFYHQSKEDTEVVFFNHQGQLKDKT